MDWTEDMISRIRALWAEGHSTAEIGRRMGVTKNAIVGKAHRLALPPRPSPIRKMADGTTIAPRAPRSPRPELQHRPSYAPRPAQGMMGYAPAAPTAGGRPAFPGASPLSTSFSPGFSSGEGEPPRARSDIAAGTAEDRTEQDQQHRPAPFRPVAATPVRTGGSRLQPCCWPIGEPGTPEFHFCGADAVTGRPYCAEHVQVAYVKVRDRREDAA